MHLCSSSQAEYLFIRQYLVCNELHQALTDLDDLKVANTEVIISNDTMRFTFSSARFIPNLLTLRQLLFCFLPSLRQQK